MGERKVVNHYIAPDLDPQLLNAAIKAEKRKAKRLRQQRERNGAAGGAAGGAASRLAAGMFDPSKLMEVRTMLPFSIRCDKCHEFLYRGTKFNARKETLRNETYLGIRKHRFYIKCTYCSNSIAFKTDPKNADYEVEKGGRRTQDMATAAKRQEEEEEEEERRRDETAAASGASDAMRALEKRTEESKLEMDELDALDEIRAINHRHARVDTDALLRAHQQRHGRLQQQQFDGGGQGARGGDDNNGGSGGLNDDGLTEQDREELARFREARRNRLAAQQTAPAPLASSTSSELASSSSAPTAVVPAASVLHDHAVAGAAAAATGSSDTADTTGKKRKLKKKKTTKKEKRKRKRKHIYLAKNDETVEELEGEGEGATSVLGALQALSGYASSEDDSS